MNRSSLIASLTALALLAACKKEEPPPLYEAVAVTRRNITVSAEAAGTVEPILVVDVKSRASGTILRMLAETGDMVREGDTLVIVDKRDPTTALRQAEADLAVAQAQLSNADANRVRSDTLFARQLLSEQEHQSAGLAAANARAQLVRAQASVQSARDQLADTDVRAPVSGTIILKSVEAGQVIASATRDVSGGTVLLKMADLSVVQVRTLVDETDIGKISADMRATVTVDAYPNQPFEGTVLKVEPQSVTNQNVTMFPVLIRIPNPNGRLRPGMNANVQMHVAERPGVLAIPNASLRTPRDVASAAQVLGLDPAQVEATLARADSAAGTGGQAAGRSGGQNAASPNGERSFGGSTPNGAAPAPRRAEAPAASQPTAAAPQNPQRGAGGFGGFTLPEGVTQEMAAEIRRKRQAGEALTPAESTASARMREAMQRAREAGGQADGRTGGQADGRSGGQSPAAAAPAPTAQAPAPGGPSEAEQAAMRAAFQKQMSGGTLTPAEQALVARARQMMASAGGQRRRFGANNNFQFGGSYIVFVLRNGTPTPVRIRTGVTDMDYSEVASGLTDQDTVLLLPSASLVAAQKDMRERFTRMTGGGGLPGMSNQPAAGTTRSATPTTPPRP